MRGQQWFLGLSLLVVLGLLVSPVATVAAQPTDGSDADRFVRGQPDLDAHVPVNLLIPGETQAIDVVITNDGTVSLGSVDNRDSVTAARNVRVTASAPDDGINVETGTVAFGSVSNDRPQTAGLSVSVAEDLEPGEYDLEVELEYSYTYQISDRAGVTDERTASRNRTVTIEVDDDARFVVRNSTTTAAVGDTGLLSLEIENIGTETVYDVRVMSESTSSRVTFVDGSADEAYVGAWAPGERQTVTYAIAVASPAAVRSYPISTTIRYDDVDGLAGSQTSMTSGFVPNPEHRFVVHETTTTGAIGETGELHAAVEYVGNRDIQDIHLNIESLSPHLRFGGSPSDGVSIDSWTPGETKTLSFDVRVQDAATVRSLPLEMSVRYSDQDAITQRNTGIEHGVTPLPEQTLSVSAVESQLRVGEDGAVSGTITNHGPHPIEDITIRLAGTPSIHPIEPEYSIVGLEPGETAAIHFPVEIGQNAESGPRSLPVTVDYRNPTGDLHRADDLVVHLPIEPRRHAFSIEPIDAELPAGSTGQTTFSITNNLDDPVDDVHVKIFTDGVFSSNDDEAYLTALEPGETETFHIDLEIDDNAIPKSHALSADVKYVDHTGKTQLSDAYTIGITIIPASDRRFWYVAGFIVVLLLVITGGLVGWRRR